MNIRTKDFLDQLDLMLYEVWTSCLIEDEARRSGFFEVMNKIKKRQDPLSTLIRSAIDALDLVAEDLAKETAPFLRVVVWRAGLPEALARISAKEAERADGNT